MRNIEWRNLVVNPDELASPVGYSHPVRGAAGRSIYLAGEIAWDSDERIVGDTWVEQFDQALSNLVTALTWVGMSRQQITVKCGPPLLARSCRSVYAG